ncbi:hypothetical protein [Chryseobacterium sp.]|uniref:hypothetical protein n=1 Tax=Chryseobacterium sp. TaxID=1871047 RepID=UPI0025BDA11F|nr:hypothetical protein [Chryseobacterium sp.]MBV8327693.1 hypothetical protein [Chryseobacterium sp.]
MKIIPKINCTCEQPPLHYFNYKKTSLGIDVTNGRYGEVSIDECIHCGRKWLHYFVEYEHYSRSGRWYSGLISEDDLSVIIPENAIQYLESLEWYVYGGSYFASAGSIGSGKARIDL